MTPPDAGGQHRPRGDNPAVSIILLNWNRGDDTLACLESLRALTDPGVHIIVVDNASHDGSPDRIARAFPEVELIRNPINRGFAGANNQGLQRALARGDAYALVLNNDTLVAPDFLHHLVAAAEAHSRIGMVCPKILYVADRTRLWYAGGMIHADTGETDHRGKDERDEGQYDVPGAVEYATGCCLLVRRAVLETVGWFDEAYFAYYEDTDWSLRTRAAGYSLWYEPRAVIWHKESASSAGMLAPLGVYYALRNRVYFLRRHSRLPLWRLVPRQVLFFARRLAALLLKHRRWDSFRAGVLGLWHGLTGRMGEKPNPKRETRN